jgi:hypothetical protein
MLRVVGFVGDKLHLENNKEDREEKSGAVKSSLQ